MPKPEYTALDALQLVQRCANCTAIVPADQLQHHHDGLLATYTDTQYCTLVCMAISTEPEAEW